MTETKRPRADRHEERHPISLVFDDAVELPGHTINWSRTGCVVEASGRLGVQVKIDGHSYRGFLVRAVSGEAGTTTYGIQLLDPLKLALAS